MGHSEQVKMYGSIGRVSLHWEPLHDYYYQYLVQVCFPSFWQASVGHYAYTSCISCK